MKRAGILALVDAVIILSFLKFVPFPYIGIGIFLAASLLYIAAP